LTGFQVFLSPHRVLDFVAATSVVAATSLCVLTSCAKTLIVETAATQTEATQTAANKTPIATIDRLNHRKVSRERTTIATRAQKIVSAARLQVGDLYDASYVDLKYPGGDVPRGRGACTDVIVRALRAVGFDLQKLIHEDKKRHPNAYPAQWRHTRADTNIDQRRVPNQTVFFKRFGKTLATQVNSSTRNQWQAGDIVQWKFDNGLDHTGVISDKTNAQGWPLVIHNVGGCAENDVLTAWKIVGHYRFPR
jgi:uncharacterized protein YijF (DUF1287 family)